MMMMMTNVFFYYVVVFLFLSSLQLDVVWQSSLFQAACLIKSKTYVHIYKKQQNMHTYLLTY